MKYLKEMFCLAGDKKELFEQQQPANQRMGADPHPSDHKQRAEIDRNRAHE
jgi:hypothetical protein